MPKTKQFGVQSGGQSSDAGQRQRSPSAAPAPNAAASPKPSKPAAAGFSAPDDARKTVMMQPFEAPKPVQSGVAPPEIELVQHELPGDAPADPRLIVITDPDSERAAAFRILRHHLLERGHPQVVAVSGPTERCGKTTTAINLALALAESGRGSVLLVDGNFRRPELAGMFRFVPPWCFAEQLALHKEQPDLPWGLVDVVSHHLHIGAINPRTETAHRLDGPAFSLAMDRLRLANYDHIIVDCPSVLGSADVNLIQDAADGVLLCARVKEATARDMTESVRQLSPSKILGTTLLE